ncbi:hypothetical protein [Sphingobium yanoikuyae]|uniref:hypothetical protein n=1 Tax=Sphingobium yanoikuyae TaxID=13690 RepID=UPI0035C6AE60
MTDLDKIMANLPTPEEIEADKAERRAALIAATASGLFACATDITAMNKERGVEDGAHILLEGAALFVAQLYEGVHRGMGKTPKQARELLEKAVKDALMNVRRVAQAAEDAAEEQEGATIQ